MKLKQFKIENKQQFNKILLMFCTILIAIVNYSIAIVKENFYIAIISIMLIWIMNISWGMANIKRRYIFLGMNLMIFVFILSRPIISTFRMDEWWYFSVETVWKSLNAILISLLAILAGGIVAEKIKLKNENEEIKQYNNKIVKICMYIMLVITFIIYFGTEINKYLMFKNVDYANIYINNGIQYPIIIRVLASLYGYVTICILAMFPKKRETIITLILYIISAIPLFLLGSRNDIVLKCVVAVVYYLFRHYYYPNNEKWIGKHLKITMIILIPIAIIGLGAYNYIRDDKKVENTSPIDMFVDFFYKQGTTYDTICQGFENEEKLKNQEYVISYTFGDFIDYILHSTISQKIFKTESLGSGNSIKMATESNSMAHHLSYIVLGDTYLQGHGRGTSFLIEVYMDFGITGVVIYSFLLGMLLILILKLCRSKYIIIRYTIFTILSNIWVLPRYSAMGFLSFIITPQFWIVIIMLYGIEFITKKGTKIFRKKIGAQQGGKNESTKIC